MAKKEKETDDDKDREEAELVVVTDNEKNLDIAATSERVGEHDDDAPPPRKKKEVKDEDEDDEEGEKKVAKKSKKESKEEDDDEEESKDDSRLGASEESEAEEEEKKVHKSRRQRRREAENKLRNELRFYEIRNERLEKQVQELVGRQDQTEVAQLDSAIAQRRALIAKAEKVEAEALTASKGDEAVEAKKIRESAQKELDRFELRKETMEREVEEAAERPKAPAAVLKRATAWLSDNPWFDKNLGDQDSKIARTIDLALGKDGFDPATDEYWEEFDSRLAKYGLGGSKKKKKKSKEVEDDDEDEDLDEDEEDERPVKRKAAKKNGKDAKGDDDEDERPRGGPKFRTGGPGRDLKNNEVYLSAERISAMKEAGTWDDPDARKRQLKKYREWDKENAHLYRDR